MYPEIRPDVDIKTKTWTHSHPSDSPDFERKWRAHVDRKKGNQWSEENPAGSHCGTNVEGRHRHVRGAKYLFPASRRIDKAWSHDHDKSFKFKRWPGERNRHVREWHDGKDAQERHERVSRNVKDKGEKLAQRTTYIQ